MQIVEYQFCLQYYICLIIYKFCMDNFIITTDQHLAISGLDRHAHKRMIRILSGQTKICI